VWLVTACVLLALNPRDAGDELFGWRGPSLFLLCFAAVYASGQVDVGGRFRRVAQWLGDITYGCYLLHPILFFSFVWFALPHLGVAEAKDLPLATRWAVLAGVLAASCAGAVASERWLEAPVRRWGKRWLKRRRGATAPYSEAASISS
jgi:peptidoglycan/LPS O-acetylase OafA/YrhL